MKSYRYESRYYSRRAVQSAKSTKGLALWPIDFDVFWRVILDVDPAYHHLCWIDELISGSNRTLHTIAGHNISILGPRDSAKSTLCALLAAWAIGTNPSIRLVYTSYSDAIALEQSRKVKRIIASPSYQRIFPWIRAGERNNEREWEIDKNWASLYPRPEEIVLIPASELVSTYTFYGVGIRSAVMGRRADLIISDDLVKSAESIANKDVRIKIAENINDVLRPCLVPGGRWIDVGMLCRRGDIHCTYFLPKNGFKTVETSAIMTDPDGSERSYWPERHTIDRLRDIRSRSPALFTYQYQNQRPPEEDVQGAIDPNWITWVDYAIFDRYVLAIDLASGEGFRSDWTCYCLSGIAQKNIVILQSRLVRRHGNLSIMRDLVSYAETFKNLTVAFENNAYQNSLKGDWDNFITLDPSGGKLANVPLYPVPSSKALNDRLASVSGLIENGFVSFKASGQGLQPLISNLMSDITDLTHDDDVSAFALNLAVARKYLNLGTGWQR